MGQLFCRTQSSQGSKMGGSIHRFWVLAALFCLCRAEISTQYPSDNNEAPPPWPGSYSVDGIIRIPYAEIEEPFTAYYGGSRRSRVDFYGGMDKTFQIVDEGQFGAMMKLSPMTTEYVTNQMSCFQANGTNEEPVTAQSVLPKLDGYEFKGNTIMHGRDNVIMGSHYDHYYITYLNFGGEEPSDEVFNE